jgi:hypothetical protein
MASIVSSIVISKFLHCTILEIFNLKWTRIQCGVDLGCSFSCREGSAGPLLKNVMNHQFGVSIWVLTVVICFIQLSLMIFPAYPRHFFSVQYSSKVLVRTTLYPSKKT